MGTVQIELTSKFIDDVYEALLTFINKKCENNQDASFKLDLHHTRVSKVRNGTRNLTQGDLLRIGRMLQVGLNLESWNVAKTKVYRDIEEMVIELKVSKNAFMVVDDAGIGKTFSAKSISKDFLNVFYLDCSQCKTPVYPV